MGREFELKYSCSAEDFEALKAAYEGFTTIEMETTYYDTFDAKLNNRHWTLRRRYENGKSVCTLKTPDILVHGVQHRAVGHIGQIVRAGEFLGAAGDLQAVLGLFKGDVGV